MIVNRFATFQQIVLTSGPWGSVGWGMLFAAFADKPLCGVPQCLLAMSRKNNLGCQNEPSIGTYAASMGRKARK